MLHHLGYEGRTAQGLVALVADAGVTTLVDVRELPRSRRPGLSKTLLAAALRDVGVGYRHERTLGNPRRNRRAFHDGHVPEGLATYAAHLEAGGTTALTRLLDEARSEDVAALCVERDAARCHRQELVTRAEDAGIATMAW